MFRRSKQQKLPYRKKVLIAFFLITTCLLGMFALFSFAKFSNEAKRTMLRSMQDNLDNMTVSIEQAVSDTDYILSSVHADKNVQAALSVRDGEIEVLLDRYEPVFRHGSKASIFAAQQRYFPAARKVCAAVFV